MRFRFCGDLDCPDWVLAEIATLSKMSSIRMKVLVVQVLSHCLKGTFNYEKVLKIASENHHDGIADIKGAIAAIHFIIINAAKYDVDDKSLILEVQQLGLPKENTDALVKQYRDTKDMLQEKFQQDSYRITKLNQIDWRVDQMISSSLCHDDETTIEPLIHLNFNIDMKPHMNDMNNDNDVDTNHRYKDVAFELSANQLDVLIHELSHAQKLLQNISN